MQSILYLNQKIRISQSKKICPNEIINNTGKKATIRGFKKIKNKNIMPLVEFSNKKRMWLFHEEIYSDEK